MTRFSRNTLDFSVMRSVLLRLGISIRSVTEPLGDDPIGKARNRKYAYYHCPRCRRVKSRRQDLERLFVDLLSELAPEPTDMNLFKAIVLDVWRDRQADAERARDGLAKVVADRRARLDRVDEAFLHERSIDGATYERQRDQLREQVALAEIELSDAVQEQYDVTGLLEFAEHLLVNAARLWTELGPDKSSSFKRRCFPRGSASTASDLEPR